MRRPIPLITGHTYHVYNKSISKFEIFTCPEEYERMRQLITYYRYSDPPYAFSHFQRQILPSYPDFSTAMSSILTPNRHPLVHINAYTLIPSHFHFQLKQLRDGGIETFTGHIQSAYSLYFNNRHNRKGPLWQNRFQNKLIQDTIGLVRNTLYIHYNPTKHGLKTNPTDWKYSSLRKYLGRTNKDFDDSFCDPYPLHEFLPCYEPLIKDYRPVDD